MTSIFIDYTKVSMQKPHDQIYTVEIVEETNNDNPSYFCHYLINKVCGEYCRDLCELWIIFTGFMLVLICLASVAMMIGVILWTDNTHPDLGIGLVSLSVILFIISPVPLAMQGIHMCYKSWKQDYDNYKKEIQNKA